MLKAAEKHLTGQLWISESPNDDMLLFQTSGGVFSEEVMGVVSSWFCIGISGLCEWTVPKGGIFIWFKVKVYICLSL